MRYKENTVEKLTVKKGHCDPIRGYEDIWMLTK